jgi:hypothetical protein
MAMGTRKSAHSSLWIPTSQLPKSPGHPFCTPLNVILDAQGVDPFVEDLCRDFYAVDLDTAALLAVTIQGADEGDTTT